MILRSAARWRRLARPTPRRSLSSSLENLESRPVAAALTPAKERFISPEVFAESYLRASRPGLFPALVKGGDRGGQESPYAWPACKEWSTSEGPLSGMRNITDLQDTLVEVEISQPGRGYGEAIAGKTDGPGDDASTSWSKVSMPFGLFLDAFIEGKIPWQNNHHDAPRMVGYVAQQDLFEKSPELVRQCPPLAHTKAGQRGDREQWRRNVWIGGADSFTPIHCDPYENFYTQVVGSKRVHIFPPSLSSSLYLFSSSTTAQGNTSSIPREDFLLSDHEEKTKHTYPLLRAALAHPDTRQTTLQAGDALFIPKGWFHCFRSTSISASVNSWFR